MKQKYIEKKKKIRGFGIYACYLVECINWKCINETYCYYILFLIFFVSGREQAVLTGNRLKLLDLPYTSLTSSTMTRAIETAELIHKHIPTLQHVTDDCLREGAPIPPEPPIGSWRPETKVILELSNQ